MAHGLDVQWLGRVPYAQGLEIQDRAVLDRKAGRIPDRLLLLEHPTVITLGRSSQPEHLLVGPDELARRGIEVHSVPRGGDVTLHAPGQLVGYLVADLDARGERDLHLFVRRMEAALMAALDKAGLGTRRVEGRTGVFMPAQAGSPDRKIASIGIGVRRWVTFHGFALNVTTDLDVFDTIVPCGLGDVRMTSVCRELGTGPLALDARMRALVEESFVEVYAEAERSAPAAGVPAVP